MMRLMITTAALGALAMTGACSGQEAGDENQAVALENVTLDNSVSSAPIEPAVNVADENASSAEEPSVSTTNGVRASQASEPKSKVEPVPAQKQRSTSATATKATSDAAPKSAPKEEPKAATPAATCAPEHRALGHC